MKIQIRKEESFIRLGQLLKKAGIVQAGVDAKMLIQDGQVEVNGEVETRRGRKLYDGDSVSCILEGESHTLEVVSSQ